MKLQIMDHTGHTTEEIDTSTRDGTSAAMRRFAELVSEHKMTPARRNADGSAKVIKHFSEIGTATEVLFIPQLQGG